MYVYLLGVEIVQDFGGAARKMREAPLGCSL